MKTRTGDCGIFQCRLSLLYPIELAAGQAYNFFCPNGVVQSQHTLMSVSPVLAGDTFIIGIPGGAEMLDAFTD